MIGAIVILAVLATVEALASGAFWLLANWWFARRMGTAPVGVKVALALGLVFMLMQSGSSCGCPLPRRGWTERVWPRTPSQGRAVHGATQAIPAATYAVSMASYLKLLAEFSLKRFALSDSLHT